MVYLFRFFTEGMGMANYNEIFSSKASRGVNRIFYGIILVAPAIGFLTFNSLKNFTNNQIYSIVSIILLILVGPSIFGTLINDIILGMMLKINYFRTSDKAKVEELRFVYSRWRYKPGHLYNQWPISWKRYTSSGDWGTGNIVIYYLFIFSNILIFKI